MLTTVEQAIGDATLPDLYHAHGGSTGGYQAYTR
jgi:hypothetical protein